MKKFSVGDEYEGVVSDFGMNRGGHRQGRCLSRFRAPRHQGREGAFAHRPCQEGLRLRRAYRGFISVKRSCKTRLPSFRQMRRVRSATSCAPRTGGGQASQFGAHFEKGSGRSGESARGDLRFSVGVPQQTRSPFREVGGQSRARVLRKEVSQSRALEGVPVARRVGEGGCRHGHGLGKRIRALGV